MEKYNDFAFASKENLENLSKAYDNSLKVDALNTGESGNNNATSPSQRSGSGTTAPNQNNTAVPTPSVPATPVKTTPKKNNSLAQFNLLLFAMMIALINDNGGGCSNRW